MALQVLIADDEPHISRALSFVLERGGFSVHVAGNGEEALRMIRKERPRIVFLDIVMPKMGGVDLCREVKNDPELRGTCIIILTARGQEVDRRDAMSAGADAYLTKPFSPREVLEQVMTIISRGEK